MSEDGEAVPAMGKNRLKRPASETWFGPILLVWCLAPTALGKNLRQVGSVPSASALG